MTEEKKKWKIEEEEEERQRILNQGCYKCGKKPATLLSINWDNPICDDCNEIRKKGMRLK